MLRVLRENAQSWMLRGILALVAVTFISWGGYSFFRDRGKTYAARVNGVTIGIEAYDQAYSNARRQYQEVLGASFSEKMLQSLKLGDRILDDMISRILMLQEAKRLGLSVSEDEVRQSIESVPGFQVEGQFDPRIYERTLQMNRLSPDEFERMQRDGLLVGKLAALVRLNGGKVSPDEVLETFRYENERMNLAFLKVSPQAFNSQVAVNEIDIKDYYQKHQEEFRLPAAAQVQYLVFRPSDYEGKVNVSPEDLQRYYNTQKERLKVPKRVKGREILIKVNAGDSPEAIDQKRKKAEEALEKAKKAKDFGSVAKQVSESETAAKGGDMGWVQKGSVDDLVQTALFALKPGEISGVVKGVAGFYILKADEVLEEKQRSLEEVKDQITLALRREKARAEASRRADDAFYSIFRSRDLESYAKEKNVPVRTTGYFKEGEEIPEIGKDPSFASSAFSLKLGEISPVVNIQPNSYILKLMDKKESRIPPLEEVKDDVKAKAIAAQCDVKARQTAEEILKEVQTGKLLRDVGREKGFQVDETGYFTRTAGAIPKIGPSNEFTKNLSPLTEQNPTPKEVLNTREGYFVVRLISLERADEKKFESVKGSLEKRLAAQKQEDFFNDWIEQLKAKAKIDKNPDIVKS
jgi:peptidyl-prolyl cis-trans isomerase D